MNAELFEEEVASPFLQFKIFSVHLTQDMQVCVFPYLNQILRQC